MPPDQNYSSHRSYHALYHFFVLPVLSLNILYQLYLVIRYRQPQLLWGVIVSCAVASLALLVRTYPLRMQDRIIRLEETQRLTRCLPEELRARIGELSMSQMIGLRFCDDEELPELTRAVLDTPIRGREEIKQRIKTWRPDRYRI